MTRSDVSHVFIEYYSDEWDMPLAFEAHGLFGVRLVPSDKARHDVVEEYTISLGGYAIMASLRDRFGQSYDYGGMFGFALAIVVRRWFGLRIRNLFGSPSSQVCSELVASLFKDLGLPGTSSWDVELTSPKRLVKYCRKGGGGFVSVA